MQTKDDFRTGLADLIEKLTLGPLSVGETIDSAPVDTYLTGILWPRGVSAGAENDEPLAPDEESDLQFDAGVPGYRAMRPCSIGLSFTVGADVDLLVSLGSTARYKPEELSSGAEGDRGAQVSTQRKRPNLKWHHQKLDYQLSLPGGGPAGSRSFNEFVDRAGGHVKDHLLTVHVKRRVDVDLATWTVTLINSATESDDTTLRDSICLFQSQILVSVVGGIGDRLIRPRRQTKPIAPDSDTRSNQLIYRKAVEYAAGHGIAVEWDDEPFAGVSSVRTSWLPRHVVHGTDPRGHADLQNVLKVHAGLLEARWLGHEGSREEIISALEAFARSYQQWIDARIEARMGEFDRDEDQKKAAHENLQRCRDVFRRIFDGVNCLAADEKAWEAFRMANQVMDRQSRLPVKGDRVGPLVWRPFQLAYIIMVIPSLVDPIRWLDERECMDLLWFPTGGGKTEAYLGLTAFQILHRRLVSESSRRSGGVDVLMRYTLRLLTVQQFQRAATLICACDLMRLELPEKLGTAPISIGLYVGRDTTPNSMGDAREALRHENTGEKPKSTPMQLLACPLCASPLQSRNYRASLTGPILEIKCEAKGCPSGGQSLPILVVDECIYHQPPSLLIGTVDKFAQLPRNQNIGSLFGIGRHLPPGLIIQDELHLISGPLGSMSGLYEAAIDILCTRDGIRPKIIGSTATIGRAEQQVKALFDRSVLQFPPPGVDADDSFFAVKEHAEGQDRLYIGISSAGRSPKFALQAALAALLQGAQKLAESSPDVHIRDPYWTCVAYFNSLRELGGAHVQVQDDVPRQMTFLSRRLGSSCRDLFKNDIVTELSSRVSSREIPVLLERLGARLSADPMDEQPEDIVLASNMISVGVDVPRLGLMLVNGQPKSTSEYIQATSRVGRGLPGLVITLYNFNRPRDLSHFEHFKGYHAALYRAVEATSVTPWAPRARDKGLPAVLIGTVRHLLPGLSSDEGAAQLQSGDPRVIEIVEELVRRCRNGSGEVEDEETAEELQNIVKEWELRAAAARSARSKLIYWERKSRFGNASPHLLRSAEDIADPGSAAWAAPSSMREVEPSAAFVPHNRKGN